MLVPGVPGRRVRCGRSASSLRSAVRAQPVAIDGETRLRVTASVGAARAEAGLWSVDGLVDAADRALYAAKRRGRDRVVLISDLTVEDLVAEEPEAIRLARALALQAALREGMPERHAEEVAELAAGDGDAPGPVADDGLPLPARRLAARRRQDVAARPHPAARRAARRTCEWERAARPRHPAARRSCARSRASARPRDAVRHHHERWDGHGYPDGLAGDAIPIEARVVAACDAYSSMTTDRARSARRGRADGRDRGAAPRRRRTSSTRTSSTALLAVLEGSPGGELDAVERLLEP